MVCTSCSNGITKELEALKGVHSVRISLALGEADIEYDTRVSKVDIPAAPLSNLTA